MVAKRKDNPGEIKAIPAEILADVDDMDLVEIDPGTGAGGDDIVYRFLNPEEERDTLPPGEIETDELLFSDAEDKTVGEMFARARDSVGMNKVEASKGSQIARADLNAFERGERSPTLRTLRKYAKALGYKVKIHLEPTGSE